MARRRSANATKQEVYFEFIFIGNAVKVSAIDAKSGEEVSISGPSSAGQDELQRVALQKLKRKMGLL